MNLSKLQEFLGKIGRRPNRKLSQNFLIDENIAAKIVHLAEIKPKDKVLEIGPGPGALTSFLLAKGAEVLAIEKDPLLAQALCRFQTIDHRLFSQCADFLNFDLSRLESKYKLVANLPYHITTPILEKILEWNHLFSSITVMVQEELAKRIQSPPLYYVSASTIFIQCFTRVHSSFKVPSSAFFPQPKVQSTVIRFDICPHCIQEPKQFFQFVKQAFQQKRKMLRTSLSIFYPIDIVEDALKTLGIKENARPETLTPDQWMRLYTNEFNSWRDAKETARI